MLHGSQQFWFVFLKADLFELDDVEGTQRKKKDGGPSKKQMMKKIWVFHIVPVGEKKIRPCDSYQVKQLKRKRSWGSCRCWSNGIVDGDTTGFCLCYSVVFICPQDTRLLVVMHIKEYYKNSSKCIRTYSNIIVIRENSYRLLMCWGGIKHWGRSLLHTDL